MFMLRVCQCVRSWVPRLCGRAPIGAARAPRKFSPSPPRARFSNTRADFVRRAVMPCARPGSAPKPRGRPRMAFDDLKPSTKRWRRWLDAKKSTALVMVETQPRPTKVPKKRGRPCLPYEKLGKWGRAKRKYFAGLAEKRAPLLMAPLLDAAAAIDTEEAQQGAAAERAAAVEARREARLAKLQKELAERNGEGRIGLLRRESVQLAVPRGTCLWCLEETDTFAPCCSTEEATHWMCAGCVRQHALVYARSPEERGALSSGGGPVPRVVCRAVGVRCPVCKRDGAFANGARGLLKAAS